MSPTVLSSPDTGATHRTMGVVVSLLLLVAVFVLPSPATAATVLDDSALFLGFEDDLLDTSSAAHPVEARAVSGHQPSHTFVPGVKDGTKALRLTSGTYLDLGTSVDLQPAALTVAFWLKPETAMSGKQVITWNKQADNSDGWYLSDEELERSGVYHLVRDAGAHVQIARQRIGARGATTPGGPAARSAQERRGADDAADGVRGLRSRHRARRPLLSP